MAVEIFHEPDGVFVRVTGVFDAVSMMEGDRAVHEHPNADKLKWNIWDCLGVTEVAVTKKDKTYAAAADKGSSEYIGDLRVALVMTHKDLIESAQGYIKLAAQLENPWVVCIFDNLEDARAFATGKLSCDCEKDDA